MFFWTVFAVDVLAAMVVFYFFVIGLADGSVSSFNIALWLGLLAGIAAMFTLGLFLKLKGRGAAANGVLLILAGPAFLFGLFVISLIVFQPRWN